MTQAITSTTPDNMPLKCDRVIYQFFIDDPGWYDPMFIEENTAYAFTTIRFSLHRLWALGLLQRRKNSYGVFEYALSDTKAPPVFTKRVTNGDSRKRKTVDYIMCQYSKCIEMLPKRPEGKSGPSLRYCSKECQYKASRERNKAMYGTSS